MDAPNRFLVLDLETRIHLPLARAVLNADASMSDADVRARLSERRKAQSNGSDFQKLPFHEPVAAAMLLVERRGEGADAPLSPTEWRCWTAGDLPLEQFVARFFEAAEGRAYIGFNSQSFDLPLMELWASRTLVAAPAHFADRPAPRDRGCERHCDLQKELVNFAFGSGTLDELCKFHGLPGKPGVGGEDVELLVKEGRLEEVHAYNVTDVLQTHLLFLHVQVRAGKLTRRAAGESARAAIALTREKVAAHLAAGGRAKDLLERCLDGCARSPIATSN